MLKGVVSRNIGEWIHKEEVTNSQLLFKSFFPYFSVFSSFPLYNL